MKDQSEFQPFRPKKRPRSFRNLWRPKIIIGSTLAVLASVWFVFGEAGIWDSHKMSNQFEVQAEQIAQLEAEKKHLEGYLEALKKGDETALENAARDYSLVAPGERIYEIQVTESAK